MIISSGESDRRYLEKILDELESKPLNEYKMSIIETKEDGDYRHVQIMIDIIETESGRNR